MKNEKGAKFLKRRPLESFKKATQQLQTLAQNVFFEFFRENILYFYGLYSIIFRIINISSQVPFILLLFFVFLSCGLFYYLKNCTFVFKFALNHL